MFEEKNLFVTNFKLLIMRKLFLNYRIAFALTCVIYLLSSCQSDIWEETLELEASKVSTKTEGMSYIDVDLSELSTRDTAMFALYIEARNRMDKFIEYKDGQYVLNAKSGAEMNISEVLFLNFKRAMERTNDEIRNKCMIEVAPKVLKEVQLTPKMLLNSVQTKDKESGGGDWFPPMSGGGAPVDGGDEGNDGGHGGGHNPNVDMANIQIETEYFWGGYVTVYTLSNEQAKEFFYTMKEIYGWDEFGIGALLDLYWSPKLVATVISLAMTINENMYENWYEEAMETGSKYEIWDICYYDGEAGNPHTLYVKRIE